MTAAEAVDAGEAEVTKETDGVLSPKGEGVLIEAVEEVLIEAVEEVLTEAVEEVILEAVVEVGVIPEEEAASEGEETHADSTRAEMVVTREMIEVVPPKGVEDLTEVGEAGEEAIPRPEEDMEVMDGQPMGSPFAGIVEKPAISVGSAHKEQVTSEPKLRSSQERIKGTEMDLPLRK